MNKHIKADLHMHTNFSPDSLITPNQLVRKCESAGLNCIAVTDHNTIQGAMEIRDIAPFRVIIGEEIRTSEGEVIGLFLEEKVPEGLSPKETANRIHSQGGLLAIPHPFDKFRRSVITQRGLLDLRNYATILEAFNARNTFQSSNQNALKLAQEWGTLTSAVSDAHTTIELGRTYMEMPDFDGTAAGFIESVRQARLIMRPMTPLIHVITTLTKIWKRMTIS